MNLQIAATLDGELAAVGPVPVHGARRDGARPLTRAVYQSSPALRLLGRGQVAAAGRMPRPEEDS